MSKAYYKWKDIASVTALFLIMVGHMGGNNPGGIRPFISVFANPIFFFLGGLFADRSTDSSIKDVINKNVKRLLLPYCGWVFINVVWFTLMYNKGWRDALRLLCEFVILDRKHIEFGGTAWFLVGLFVCRSIYFILRKICQSKYITFVVCMFISLLMCIIYTPDMGYGYIDSIFWMPFYAFGAICFSALNKTYEGIKQCWSGKYRLLFWGGYVIVTLYATTVFFGGVGFFFKNADAYFYRVMCYLIIPGILSVWLVVTSFFIPQSVTLCELGRNTLVLCGTESIVKSLAYFMNMLGFAVGPTGGGRMLLVGSFFIRNRV